MPMDFSRRRMLLASAGASMALAGAGPLEAAEPEPPAEPFPANADAALKRLLEGNRRFVSGTMRHQHQSRDWRRSLTTHQKPFATILSCSDSRVPVEMIFDQGFGDLFVIRVAGNVVAADVVGSIEYAVLHLETPLLLILGHEGCGAVTAALAAMAGAVGEPVSIQKLVALIEPGLKGLDPKLDAAGRLRAAVEANVRWGLRQLSEHPDGKKALEAKRVALQGAVYELESGAVRLVK